MELLNRQNYRKLYVQLYDKIRKKIEDKEWTIGFQIPTEQELCKVFNVSRATVRSAVLELVRQGYLTRQQGRGTFVSKKAISDKLTMFVTFGELMLGAETDLLIDVLAQTIMMPLDGLDDKLNISGDKHIIYIKRLWKVNNKPILIQETYIPFHICPPLLEEDVKKSSLFELLEKKYEIQITGVKNYFDVTCLNADEGRILDLSENSPALVLTQHFFSGETQIMYMRSVKRPGEFELSIECERKTT
ncbi:MAG: GntR family transcriptional regulator [Nitrospirae bacterium]|nr:GntR family transcriptional regulator [Nitrospirota bacterium]